MVIPFRDSTGGPPFLIRKRPIKWIPEGVPGFALWGFIVSKRIFIVLTALVCVASVCGPIAVGHAEEDRICIAFVGDFSGPTREFCRKAYDGALLAVQDINDQGGLLGRQVEIIKLDGGNDPQRHYRYVTELGARKEVAAVFAGGTSSVLLEGSRASLEQRTPYLITMGNSQSLVVDHGHPYVFLFQPSTYMETKAFSIFASLMPWRKYVWIGPDYIWGREVFNYYRQHFAALGSPIEWKVQIWHPLGTPDFRPMIEDILKAEPEALVIASWGEDLQRFIDQAQPYGFIGKMPIFAPMLPENPKVEIPDGIWSVSRAPFNYLADKYPQTEAFAQRFLERYQTNPSGFPICSYDAVLAWRGAVLKANSFDREAVAEALKGLTFQGLRGDSYIRPIDGQMDCPTYIGRSLYRFEPRTRILDSVIEIPATKTWPSEQEILKARKKAAGP